MAAKSGKRTYVPRRGDAVWLEFAPQAGHEQSGVRPAVVLSPTSYNERSSLIIVVPVTHTIKGYPFEVVLPASLPIAGAVLCDQVKSLDWQARRARFICSLPDPVMKSVLQRTAVLFSPE